jgi:hypothetical protein
MATPRLVSATPWTRVDSSHQTPFEAASEDFTDGSDNAPAESGIGPPKAEANRRRGPWRSFEAVALATLERADRFNDRRPFEPIGDAPPADTGARCDDRIEELAILA